MLNTDVLIIGGGVVGSYLASILPTEIDRTIVDQKEPIRKDSCSGIVSKRIEELIGTETLAAVLDNELAGVNITWGGQTVKLDNETYVLNRNKLNSLLIKQAKESGANLLRGERARNLEYKQGATESDKVVVKTDQRQIRAKVMVDCSGAAAFAQNELDLAADTKQYPSGTVRLRREQTSTKDCNRSRVFYNESYSSTHFAWILPRGEEVEYGVIGSPQGLQQFLQDHNVTAPSSKFRFNKIQLGEVETCADRVMLLGEAACQTKPVTGGGIVFGMIAAHSCQRAIKQCLANDRFSQSYLQNVYAAQWQEKIRDSIQLQLELQSLLERLDFNRTQLPEIELEADYDLIA